MVAKIVVKVHPDTYPTHLSGFLSYDGVTMPKSHEWTDAHVPRTDRPVRFRALVWRTMRPGYSPRGRMQDTLRRWFHNSQPLGCFGGR